jgi:NDP-sugar pyrophosphorylase family protein
MKDLTALILTGGLGTRLRPLTLDCPKPLLPIGNAPFLTYPIALLRKHKIQSAVLCMADSITPYQTLIRKEAKLGTQIHSSQEFEELGTAGALKNAEKYVKCDLLFVFNGDILTDLDLTEMVRFHNEKKAAVTVALRNVTDPSPYGLALMNGTQRIERFIEKPEISTLQKKEEYPVNAGTYLWNRQIFERIPKNTKYSVEKQLYPDCLSRDWPIYGFLPKQKTYWIDIGTPEKYLKANQDMVSENLFDFKASVPHCRIGKGTRIHPSAAISKKSVIGAHCQIGSKTVINDCIVLDHVKIEEDCVLENSIVGSYSKIQHHVRLGNLRVLGSHSTITPFSKL